MQLNAQIGPESSRDKGHAMDLSRIENGSTVKPQHTSSEAVDLDDNPTHLITTKNDNHTGARMGILGDEVAVDSSSMCTLALHLSSGDRTSSGPFIENGELLRELQDTGADTTKKLCSTDIELKSPGGLEISEKNHNSSMVDVEPVNHSLVMTLHLQRILKIQTQNFRPVNLKVVKVQKLVLV